MKGATVPGPLPRDASVLTRRLSLKLLAPTVMVSLLLVGTCLAGAIYLNRLHLSTSRIHTENVESTSAAATLAASAEDLLALLRDEQRDPAALARQLPTQHARLQAHLSECEQLANLPQEQELVRRIDAGLTQYLGRWERVFRGRPGRAARMAGLLAAPASQGPLLGISYAAAGRAIDDTALAALVEDKVLQPCRQLRQYNLSQVRSSDQEHVVLLNRLTWLLLVVAVGAPVGGLVLGYAVARSLYHSMYQLSVQIRDAAGRLTGEVQPVTLAAPQDLPDLNRQMQDVVKEIERVLSQLHQRDREVLRAEQLAAVGQVAAGVAHELRNPLTSIKMLVQTALEGPGVEHLAPEDLAVIEAEVRRMEATIRTFLDFARPPRTERRRTDLREVVRRSLALVEGRAQRQHVALTADLPPEPVELPLDAEQVHQVLVNLLLNALDMLPRGGRVKFAVRPAAGGGAVVTVADDGPGIAPHVRERLFEPFVSGKDSGLGLGLSICRRLIEAHGGTIRGDNAPEGGAVFTFTLPGGNGSEVRSQRSEVRGQRSEVRGQKSEVSGP
jgi:signal transduction histidine kinase